MHSSMSSSDLTPIERQLIGALVGLSRAASGNEDILTADTHNLLLQGLSALRKDTDSTSLRAIIDRLHAEKARLAPDCSICPHPCGRTADWDMDELLLNDESVRSLKTNILSGLIYIASAASGASLPCEDYALLYDALGMVADGWNEEYLSAFEKKLRLFHTRLAEV